MAQRLCDLLLSFPSSAAGGVQWNTLARKYAERHGAKLDLPGLGFPTPLVAATALLWDVLRLVDADDTDNPVVAVEDAMVMVPRPGSLGTWPSLYQTLCNIVQSNGTTDDSCPSGRQGKSLLLSKLKPLLQIHWHTNFDESGLGYLSDEGTFIRLKKMKHLVQAVLRWRDQRIAWRATSSPKASPVDEALQPFLECVASQRHNDLVLRLVEHGEFDRTISSSRPSCEIRSSAGFTSQSCDGKTYPQWETELAKLRAENSLLRTRNLELEQQPGHMAEGMNLFIPQLAHDPFDDPFEPPPQKSHWTSMTSPTTSTYAASSEKGFSMPSGSVTPDLGNPWVSHFGSGSHTPASMSLGSSFEAMCSGATTPMQTVGGFTSGTATPGGVCLVPVWFHPTNFAFTLGDRGVIPCGIVQQARAFFEPSPSSGVPAPMPGFAA